MTNSVFPADLPEDGGHRRWLGGAPVAGDTGLVIVVLPFRVSLAPGGKVPALGTPIEVAVGSLRPSKLRAMGWLGKPVFVLRRTPEMIGALAVKHWNTYFTADDAMLTGTNMATMTRRNLHASSKRLTQINLMRDILSRFHGVGRKDRIMRPDPDIVFDFSPDFLEADRLTH